MRNTIWINPVYIRIFLARTIISDFLSISMKHPVSFKLNCAFIQCKQQKVLSCFFYSDFCLLIAISQNLNHKVPIAAYSNIIKKNIPHFLFSICLFLDSLLSNNNNIFVRSSLKHGLIFCVIQSWDLNQYISIFFSE